MNFKRTNYLFIIVLFVVSSVLISCQGKSKSEFHDITDRDHLFLEGIVTFDQEVDKAFIRQVLGDLFVKYIKLEFNVENKNGKFSEVVDQSLNPRLDKMIHGSEIESNDYYYELKQFCKDWSYFYSIQIDQIKLTDETGALYKKESKFDYIKPVYVLYEGAEKLAQQNHVTQIMFDKIRFTETGRIHLHKFFDF